MWLEFTANRYAPNELASLCSASRRLLLDFSLALHVLAPIQVAGIMIANQQHAKLLFATGMSCQYTGG
jgi:hypothetical protein